MSGPATSGAAWRGGKAEGTAEKLYELCAPRNELTIALWFYPPAVFPSHDGRIFSFSNTAELRNVTVQQDLSGVEIRLRVAGSTPEHLNGDPSLEGNSSLPADTLAYLAYRYSADGSERIDINGELVATGTRVGDMMTWFPSYPLILGNEAGARELIRNPLQGIDMRVRA